MMGRDIWCISRDLRGDHVDDGTMAKGGGYSTDNYLRSVIGLKFSASWKHVISWTSRLYMTGVAAAQLRWHLPNMNVIQIIQ